MPVVIVSPRGQVTLPASVRRALGILPGSRVEISVMGEEIVIRWLRSVRELKGVFRAYAKGKSSDWGAVREETMRRVVWQMASE